MALYDYQSLKMGVVAEKCCLKEIAISGLHGFYVEIHKILQNTGHQVIQISVKPTESSFIKQTKNGNLQSL